MSSNQFHFMHMHVKYAVNIIYATAFMHIIHMMHIHVKYTLDMPQMI